MRVTNFKVTKPEKFFYQDDKQNFIDQKYKFIDQKYKFTWTSNQDDCVVDSSKTSFLSFQKMYFINSNG